MFRFVCLCLLAALCQMEMAVSLCAQDSPAGGSASVATAAGATARLNHADLSVYRAADGTLQPIRSAADWQQRRQQILEGMQRAMGPLPQRNTALPFDVRVVEDRRLGAVRRLTLTIAVDSVTDRLPLDLYVPAALADTVTGENLTGVSGKKTAAILALHPTGEEIGRAHV
mgnify:FL=1